jgi:hypothetical protein
VGLEILLNSGSGNGYCNQLAPEARSTCSFNGLGRVLIPVYQELAPFLISHHQPNHFDCSAGLRQGSILRCIGCEFVKHETAGRRQHRIEHDGCATDADLIQAIT